MADARELAGAGLQIPDGVRALIGRPKTRRCLVTSRDIRRFCQAIGETDDLSEEPTVAPPLFCQTMTFDELPLEELPADGSPGELDLPLAAARLVGGSSEYAIHRRVRAGDWITVESELKDVSAKQGKSGPLYLVVVETRFVDQDQRVVATEVATYVKQP